MRYRPDISWGNFWCQYWYCIIKSPCAENAFPENRPFERSWAHGSQTRWIISNFSGFLPLYGGWHLVEIRDHAASSFRRSMAIQQMPLSFKILFHTQGLNLEGLENGDFFVFWKLIWKISLPQSNAFTNNTEHQSFQKLA